ncbi:hypothetical protein [Streptomyces lonegramiae]|uniref:Transposase n=1 Tax=Streptomyces lonegramiae TaxID=3075524 RepID=A0ABU2XVL2_9ACTN|nr:hypothetical protein [Streptomyces sp. DSM 41529]MDT0549965.1 hypothetical protein [Streptomyces sp. DSM 41529]
MTQVVVEVGARLRYDGRVWTLAVLEGARATLVSDEGASAVVLLPYLFAHPTFGVEGGPTPGRVPPFGLLEALPEQVRERALAWQRHVREVETGFPDAVGQGAPREQFDPAIRSLAQRERAKAEELTAAGWSASAATVRRMRARYRSEGLWGLVDGRAVRERSAVGRADERVVAAVRTVLEGQRERSTGTLVRLRRRVGWLLEEEYGAGAVALPPPSTFNRLVHAVADGQGLLGTATQRRWHASRPAPPFTLEVPWVHAEAVRRPFTAFTFDHVRRTVQRRHGREEHEAAIAHALDALLRRASQGLGSGRERTVAARAQAAAQMTDPSPTTATVPQQWPAPLAPGASFGLPGSFTVPLQDADGWAADDSLDDLEDNQDDEDYLLAALADDQDTAADHADEAEASEPTAETAPGQAAEQTPGAAGAGGLRIYDPYQEARAW